MGTKNKEQIFLTPQELADRWRIHVRSLWHQRNGRQEGPKFLKIGGRILYPIEDVESFERAHTRAPSGEKSHHASS